VYFTVGGDTSPLASSRALVFMLDEEDASLNGSSSLPDSAPTSLLLVDRSPELQNDRPGLLKEDCWGLLTAANGDADPAKAANPPDGLPCGGLLVCVFVKEEQTCRTKARGVMGCGAIVRGVHG